MKNKFKSMASLGLAAGMALAGEATLSATENAAVGTHLAGGCGASCNGQNSSSSLPGYYHQPRSQARQGCGNRNGACGSRSACGSSRQFTADATDADQTSPYGVRSQTQSGTLSEREFLSQLSDHEKALYNGLSPDNKALILRMAAQEPNKDKNEIVRSVAKKMAERQGSFDRQGSFNGRMSQ